MFPRLEVARTLRGIAFGKDLVPSSFGRPDAHHMKHVLLLEAVICSSVTLHAQIVFASDLESWSLGLPAGMVGPHTTFPNGDILEEGFTYHGGAAAMRLEFGSTNEMLVTTWSLPVEEGQLYDIRFWVLGNGRIRTSVFDGRPETDGFAPYNTTLTIAEAAGWQEVVQTVYVTNTTNAAEFVFAVQGPTTLNYLLIDDITIGTSSLPDPVVATIAEIQTTASQLGTSPLNGQFVRTRGVITGFRPSSFFIQDGTGPGHGIMVQCPSPPTFFVNATVTIMATVEEYAGPDGNWSETRTQLIDVAQIIEHGYMDQLPLAITVSVADVDQEQWESTMVRIEDLEFLEHLNDDEWTAANWQGGIVVNDLFYPLTFNPGDILSIEGLVLYEGQWKIAPWNFDDGVDIQEHRKLSVEVYPNPATESTTIHCGTLRDELACSLYDAAGRLAQSGRVTGILTRIDLLQLDAGNYVLLLADGRGTKRFNLIVSVSR